MINSFFSIFSFRFFQKERLKVNEGKIKSYLFDFCQLNLHHPFGESVGAESLLERAEVEGRVAMDETLQPGLALSNGDVRGSLNAVLAVEVAFRAESIIVKKI